MKVFVTGATGWVGSAVVAELIHSGHQVTGLVRSSDKAAALTASGAAALHGTLDDLDLLRRAASEADAVVHTAFNHDFSRFAQSAQQDRIAIETLGSVLKGTPRPLLVTAGLAHIAPGRVATEQDVAPAELGYPRQSEAAANALTAQGVRACIVRLAASVQGSGDHGFIAAMIALAREKGVSAYLGDGQNRWASVHRSDAARLYRLALEQANPEPIYHAVADESICCKDIAAVIGEQLGLPVESREREHFGWLANFLGADMPASSVHTRARLGWTPCGPDLLTDLRQGDYFAR